MAMQGRSIRKSILWPKKKDFRFPKMISQEIPTDQSCDYHLLQAAAPAARDHREEDRANNNPRPNDRGKKDERGAMLPTFQKLAAVSRLDLLWGGRIYEKRWHSLSSVSEFGRLV